jgi:hypothetical protein
MINIKGFHIPSKLIIFNYKSITKHKQQNQDYGTKN